MYLCISPHARDLTLIYLVAAKDMHMYLPR